MSEPFCLDCPDREACSTGYPCEEVRRVAGGLPARSLPGALGRAREDRPTWDERWLSLFLVAGGATIVFVLVPLLILITTNK